MGEEEKRAGGRWRGIGSSVEKRVPGGRFALPLSMSGVIIKMEPFLRPSSGRNVPASCLTFPRG